MYKKRKRYIRSIAQSLAEYCVLLAVVLAALGLLQATIKRGFSGSVKEAADKMGEQYSPTVTSTERTRTLGGDQVTVEEVATTSAIDAYLPAGFGYAPVHVQDIDDETYSFTARVGHETTTSVRQQTDAAARELYRSAEFDQRQWPDFDPPFEF
ncbi:hypothetical protein ACFL38_01990 [Candidatus Omnitrophota bacterium]